MQTLEYGRDQGGAFLVIDEPGKLERELPSFTCCHCQRVVVMHPQRVRARNRCLKCGQVTCDSAGCVQECNPIARDVEKSLLVDDGQPYMLRDAHGWPVVRLPNSDLVRRRDVE